MNEENKIPLDGETEKAIEENTQKAIDKAEVRLGEKSTLFGFEKESNLQKDAIDSEFNKMLTENSSRANKTND